MNIIVFLKQVPDTATRIKIASDAKNIEESDVTWIISPYDEFALEEALRIKEKTGSGKVTVISAGPERVATSLRNALAMGVDDAVHIKDPAFDSSDAFATARALAASVKERQYDILFFGKTGVGMDQSQVPSMVAELLNLPQVSQVAKLEVQEGKVVAHREIEGATEVVEASLPVVLSAEKGLNEPRYPSLKGIMAAKKKPLQTVDLASLGVQIDPVVEIVNLSLPPARQAGKILKGDPKDTAKQLAELLRNEAKVI